MLAPEAPPGFHHQLFGAQKAEAEDLKVAPQGPWQLT
jgi:hypothetical protein